MTPNKLEGVLKPVENDACFEYSQEPEKLKKLLKELTIKTKKIGIDRYFEDDKEERIILRVYIKRGETEINFKFGISLNDTWTINKDGVSLSKNMIGKRTISDTEKTWAEWNTLQQKIYDGLLHSVLCSVGSDYHIDNNFSSFCADFGYDEDSRKAYKTWKKCLENSDKLKQIFTDEEINYMPS